MSTKKSSNGAPSWLLIEGDNLYLNTAKMAEILGISERTLRDWETKRCPKAKRGWWDPKEVIKWRTATQSGADTKNLVALKLEAEIEFKEEKIREQKLKNSVLEGQFYDKDDVAIAWATREAVMKSLIRELPKQLATEFSDEDVARKILQKSEKHIRNLIEAFCKPHNYGVSEFDELDGENDEEDQ